MWIISGSPQKDAIFGWKNAGDAEAARRCHRAFFLGGPITLCIALMDYVWTNINSVWNLFEMAMSKLFDKLGVEKSPNNEQKE